MRNVNKTVRPAALSNFRVKTAGVVEGRLLARSGSNLLLVFRVQRVSGMPYRMGSPIAARPGCESAAGSCTEGGSHAISSVGQARDEGLPPRAAANSSRGASQGHGFEGNPRHLRPEADQQVRSHAQQPTEHDANDAEASKK